MSPLEEPFDQCCDEIAKRMRICTVAAGFQVVESPTADGSFLKVWPAIFQTRRAAELFTEELVGLYAICNPEEIYGSCVDPKSYEETARVWRSLEKQGVANPRELARTFCARWPVYLRWLWPLH